MFGTVAVVVGGCEIECPTMMGVRMGLIHLLAPFEDVAREIFGKTKRFRIYAGDLRAGVVSRAGVSTYNLIPRLIHLS